MSDVLGKAELPQKHRVRRGAGGGDSLDCGEHLTAHLPLGPRVHVK